jgi:hypothetical protein
MPSCKLALIVNVPGSLQGSTLVLAPRSRQAQGDKKQSLQGRGSAGPIGRKSETQDLPFLESSSTT